MASSGGAPWRVLCCGMLSSMCYAVGCSEALWLVLWLACGVACGVASTCCGVCCVENAAIVCKLCSASVVYHSTTNLDRTLAICLLVCTQPITECLLRADELLTRNSKRAAASTQLVNKKFTRYSKHMSYAKRTSCTAVSAFSFKTHLVEQCAEQAP